MKGEDKGRIKPKAHHLQYAYWLIAFHDGGFTTKDVVWCDTWGISQLSLAIPIWILIIHKQFLFFLFCCHLAIASLLPWLPNLGSSSPLVRVHWLFSKCHPQPRTKHPSINTALLIDAPLREHKEPVTGCHKRLRQSEKRAAGACSRGFVNC